MNEKETRWNPHEYNLKLIGEHHWKWNATIVLRVKFSEKHDLKRLNKDALKFFHRIGSQLYPDAIKGYEKSFLGVCTGEIQDLSGLLHHHAILGELWKPNMWFNDSLSETQRKESSEFREKEINHLKTLSNRFQTNIQKSEFVSDYLGKSLEIASCRVDPYRPEREVGTSWRGYIVKADSNAYWSPYYHDLVKRINEVNSHNGIIPDDLIRLSCWSKDRREKDCAARLNFLFEKMGGDTNEQ